MAERHVTLYNILVVVASTVASILLGYQTGSVAYTLGQVSWYNQMGLAMSPTQPGYSHTVTITSAVTGAYYAFGFLGSIAIGPFMNIFGRISAFRFALFWHIAGSVIGAGAMNQAMYIVHRCLIGFASGNSLCIGPVYLSEIAPPLSRGAMAGMHAFGQNFGFCLGAWIGYSTSFASTSTTFGFRFPLAVPLIFGLVALGLTFWMPESPRWLTVKGRKADALNVLTRLHQAPGDTTNEYARKEAHEIMAQIAIDEAALKGRSEYAVLLTDKVHRKQLLFAILVVAGAMNTGVLVISNYSVIIYTSLGNSTSVSLLLNAVWLTLATVWNLVGAIFADNLRRRRGLVIGYAGAFICLILFTALTAKFTQTGGRSYAIGSVFFNFLFELFYGAFIDPQVWVLAGELFPTHLRTKGGSIAIAGFFVLNVVWTEAAPTAFVNIGWRYYILFVCLTGLQGLLIYFFLPETANVPLEELEELFGGRVAIHMDEIDVAATGNIENTGDTYDKNLEQGHVGSKSHEYTHAEDAGSD
ncbi:uncharacterized protein A1O5_12712 [Cladophialophora psammophila CBS 110553]|uniref:Major facilitator superfamily (MFS) profile domain-containing protein n=1 Tax=Cladophialophora psammophila CBS 110553 TaxID=1182543 RepID=W9VVL6_9EURO|nr:uncharacterized protein A1O5_12712 [Cladophialophora psammophila CBS 110553]EXJ56256.1 hypothetical protein A1O5_12712 [Cladophialophora psammophila CBS 110553]